MKYMKLFLLLVLSIIVVILGYIMKIMHYPFAQKTIIVGTISCVLVTAFGVWIAVKPMIKK